MPSLEIGTVGIVGTFGIVDTMIGIPEPGSATPGLLGRQLEGDHSKDKEGLPVGTGFKDSPSGAIDCDPVDRVLGEMDIYGIERGLIELGQEGGAADTALEKHPNRFMATAAIDPNRGMEGVRALEHAVRVRGASAAFLMPAFVEPQVPINDKKCYPLYAKCIELEIPVFITVGVPGPRVPMACQHVELLDEVCWFFPDLKIVMRHGAEPWVDLAIKLMLKWPNLYYSTSALAPEHYPKAIVDYANTRGADKVLYAGCLPSGLSLERIFRELPEVPFREQVWPKFLRENALSVLGF